MNCLSFSLLFISVYFASGSKLPDDLPRCHVTDPKLDECYQKSMQKAMKLIGTKGIPSINLPPLEPVVISKLVVGQGSSAVQLNQIFYNLSMHGFSDVKVVDGHLDWDKKFLTFTGFGEKIVQNGQYETSGNVLSLPVQGFGNFEIILTNLTCIDNMQFKEVTRKGKKHFSIVDNQVKLTVEHAHFHFDNAFNGNAALAENINMVLNENWRAVIDDVAKAYDVAYSQVAKKYASILFDTVPIDEIFLP